MGSTVAMVFYLLLSVAEQWPRTSGPRARSKNGNNGCLHVLGILQSILLSASILALRGLCLAAVLTVGQRRALLSYDGGGLAASNTAPSTDQLAHNACCIPEFQRCQRMARAITVAAYHGCHPEVFGAQQSSSTAGSFCLVLLNLSPSPGQRWR